MPLPRPTLGALLAGASVLTTLTQTACLDVSSCGSSPGVHIEEQIQAESLALSAVIELEPGDLLTARYSGTLTNLSMDSPCAFAVYEFDAPPEPADVPAIVVGQPAPELPGARLVHQGLLPAMDAHRFEVSILPPELMYGRYLGEFDATALDLTVVVSLCEDALVDFILDAELITCTPGNGDPPHFEGWLQRRW